MEKQPFARKGQQQKGIFLHEVINSLLTTGSVHAAQKGNLVSNEVQKEIQVLTDSTKITEILKRILDLVMTVSQKSHIRILAKPYSDLVLIHFKENNIQNISFVFNELKHLSCDAEQLGGFVGITTHKDTLTTIALTFLNTRNSSRTYLDRLAKTVLLTADRAENKHLP